jgi:hypothetical protein
MQPGQSVRTDTPPPKKAIQCIQIRSEHPPACGALLSLHLLLPWWVTLLVLHSVTLLHCSAKAGWAHAGNGQLVVCGASLALELSITGAAGGAGC